MELVLSLETEYLIQQSLESGRYRSAGEMVEDAVRVLVDRERCKAEYDAYLKQEIATGIEQLDRGEYKEYTDETLHELFDEIEQKVDADLNQRGAKPA